MGYYRPQSPAIVMRKSTCSWWFRGKSGRSSGTLYYAHKDTCTHL